MVSLLTDAEAHRLRELLFDDNASDCDSLDLDANGDALECDNETGDVDLAALLADIEDSTCQVARHQASMDEQARELVLLKASLEEDMRESVQHRQRLMAMKDLYNMRDDIATLHEQRLEIRASIAAAGMAESQTTDGSDPLDDGELDLQFDAMLEQIVDMRNTMEQLNVQKQLLERELLSASSEILGRFGPCSARHAFSHFFVAATTTTSRAQTRKMSKMHFRNYVMQTIAFIFWNSKCCRTVSGVEMTRASHSYAQHQQLFTSCI
jgi:hypothetical protein